MPLPLLPSFIREERKKKIVTQKKKKVESEIQREGER